MARRPLVALIALAVLVTGIAPANASAPTAASATDADVAEDEVALLWVYPPANRNVVVDACGNAAADVLSVAATSDGEEAHVSVTVRDPDAHADCAGASVPVAKRWSMFTLHVQDEANEVRWVRTMVTESSGCEGVGFAGACTDLGPNTGNGWVSVCREVSWRDGRWFSDCTYEPGEDALSGSIVLSGETFFWGDEWWTWDVRDTPVTVETYVETTHASAPMVGRFLVVDWATGPSFTP